MCLKPISLGCGLCQPGPASQTLLGACWWGRHFISTQTSSQKDPGVCLSTGSSYWFYPEPGGHHKVSKEGGEKPRCLLSPASSRMEDDLWGAGHTYHEEGASPAS